MPASRKFPVFRIAIIALVIVAAAVIVGVVLNRDKTKQQLPTPGSPAYEEYAEAFESGTAALDSDLHNVANENLSRAIEIVPQEPAAWANRGLMYLRGNRLQEATADLNKAHELAPDSPEIDLLLGLLAERKGNFDEAVTHMRRAVERLPQDVA